MLVEMHVVLLPSLLTSFWFSRPSVPYPSGWMSGGFMKAKRKPRVRVTQTGTIGSSYRGGPVIIFDPPNSPRVKARFSVLDPPNPSSHFYRPIPQHRLGKFHFIPFF